MTVKSSGPTVVEHQDRNTARTAGEQHLLDTLRDAPLDGWTVYEQPHLNGDRPDFVLVHPERGVIVIEVKDYNLASGRYAWRNNAFCVLGNDGHWHAKRSPADQVRAVRDNILQLYSRQFLAMEEVHKEVTWAVVETVVYFHHADAGQAAAICGHPKNVRFMGRAELQALAAGRWSDTGSSTLKFPRSKFAANGLLGKFVLDLESWLNPAAYMQERRAPVVLTAEQERNAAPAPGIHRRLKGAAGSGKSVVLATRAARLLAQGRRVLLVTFNITLLHYLRDLVAQQTPPEHWPAMRDRLVIFHYHGLLKWLAHKHDLKLPRIEDDLSDEDKEALLQDVWPGLVNDGVLSWISSGELDPDARFDAILIDEAQDFEKHWVSGLLPLLTPNDEMLLVYDGNQNIYQRDLVWIEHDNRGMGFRGSVAQLKKSQRQPRLFAEAGAAFVQRFIDPAYQLSADALPPQGLTRHFLHWKNVEGQDQAHFPAYVQSAVDTLTGPTFQAHHHDIVVMTDSERLALPVIKALLANGKKVTHVFDLSGDNNHRERRQQKWRFQPGNGLIKVCTLHSFKGWESPYVILLLSEAGRGSAEERAYQAYVALTRVKAQADGASSALLVYNMNPDLESAAPLLQSLSQGQTGAYMPRARST